MSNELTSKIAPVTGASRAGVGRCERLCSRARRIHCVRLGVSRNETTHSAKPPTDMCQCRLCSPLWES
jgi:hypothetical protein